MEVLGTIRFQVVDLEGLSLGRAVDATIFIDIDAAGHGWFIDKTPSDNHDVIDGMDLLTVVMHEIGHVLGYVHGDFDLMMAPKVPMMLGAGMKYGHDVTIFLRLLATKWPIS